MLEKKEINCHKSITELSNYLNSEISIFSNLCKEQGFTQSNNEDVLGKEIKYFVELFFNSMVLTANCCDILDILDVESKFGLDYIREVKGLHSRIQKRRLDKSR